MYSDNNFNSTTPPRGQWGKTTPSHTGKIDINPPIKWLRAPPGTGVQREAADSMDNIRLIHATHTLHVTLCTTSTQSLHRHNACAHGACPLWRTPEPAGQSANYNQREYADPAGRPRKEIPRHPSWSHGVNNKLHSTILKLM